ncbi:Ionotropic receptor 745 [Blattella germanica]|nr:Ionotropic receptor 745 [Blattella germanica]
MKVLKTQNMLMLISFFLSLIPASGSHFIAYIETLISTYFSPGQVIVLSLPYTVSPITKRSLDISIYQTDEYTSLNTLVNNINKKLTWPLVISTANPIFEFQTPEPQHGYIIFLKPKEEYYSLLNSLSTQIDYLQGFSSSYNRKAKFIIFVPDQVILENRKLISTELLKELMNMDKIVNAIVILQTNPEVSNENEQERKMEYDIYSIFPYNSTFCGKGDETILLRQWIHEGRFTNTDDLFPQKVPSNLNGCILNISTSIRPPYSIMNQNFTDCEGNVHYELTGIEMLFLTYLKDALNFTVNFELLEGKDLISTYITGINYMIDKVSDIYIAMFPILPFFIAYADPTIPYFFTSLEWYVPCAKPNPTSGNILKVFTIPVWVVLILVLFLAAAVFYYLAKNNKDSKVIFSDCLLSTWALLLSLSAENLPVSTKFRIFLFLFISFSLTINTVFQSFFTSFLIDPGFEKPIESIQDINRKNIPIARSLMTEYITLALSNNMLDKVTTQEVPCSDYDQCIQIALKYQNMTILAEKYKTEYVGSALGINVGTGKKYCSLDTVASGGISMYLAKGDPLVDVFNTLIQRCLEAGFLGKYWSEFTTLNALQNKNDQEESSDSYVVLGVTHLKMCFSFLLLGNFLGLIVLLIECCYHKQN